MATIWKVLTSNDSVEIQIDAIYDKLKIFMDEENESKPKDLNELFKLIGKYFPYVELTYF